MKTATISLYLLLIVMTGAIVGQSLVLRQQRQELYLLKDSQRILRKHVFKTREELRKLQMQFAPPTLDYLNKKK